MDSLLDRFGNKLFGVLNLQGIVEASSRTHEKLLGYSLDGKTAVTFVHPQDYSRVMEELAHIQQTKESKTITCRYKKNNGWTWLTAKVSPILDDHNNVVLLSYLSEIFQELIQQVI